MEEREPGVLGNLPRSRPGTRSAKRAREDRQEKAATPKPRATKPRPAKQRAGKPRAGEQPAAERRGDPVGDAFRTARHMAGAGARIGTGVAREVLRRLPGPF